jgi:hypothetical protein
LTKFKIGAAQFSPSVFFLCLHTCTIIGTTGTTDSCPAAHVITLRTFAKREKKIQNQKNGGKIVQCSSNGSATRARGLAAAPVAPTV